jgi:hypothetical protein
VCAALSDRYVGTPKSLPGPNLPLFKPPWGSLVAIDLSSRDHRWRSPVGSGNYPIVSSLGITILRPGYEDGAPCRADRLPEQPTTGALFCPP